MLFFSDFRRHVRQFFGVVLELARPSEAWCFPPRGDFFEAVLLQQPQATESVEICRKMLFFLGFQTKGWAFFWRGFGTSSSFRGMVFPPREVFFAKLFYCSSRRQQNLSKNVVFLGFQTTQNPKAAIPNPYTFWIEYLKSLCRKYWMLCILCVSLRVYALPWHNTAPCHGRRGGNGTVYFIIHELKTQTLVEVVKELLSRVKGFGG